MQWKWINSKKLNQAGLTLIELLAVIAILGIVSTIAVISISRVIQDSKDRAFVGNAFALKDAANLYLKEEIINGKVPPSVITYKDLYDSDYLDEFIDPDTKKYLKASADTFVTITDEKITAVCLVGEERNLCSNGGANTPIPFVNLSPELISDNE